MNLKVLSKSSLSHISTKRPRAYSLEMWLYGISIMINYTAMWWSDSRIYLALTAVVLWWIGVPFGMFSRIKPSVPGIEPRFKAKLNQKSAYWRWIVLINHCIKKTPKHNKKTLSVNVGLLFFWHFLLFSDHKNLCKSISQSVVGGFFVCIWLHSV